MSGRVLRCLIAVALRVLPLLVPSAAHAATDAATYVDCSAHDAGDGSLAHPLSTLAQASAVTLAPGGALLLRSGTTCPGTLAPQGSGTADEPIVVGAYGSGPRPLVAGDGSDAIVLRNLSHLVLQGLEVTNRGSVEARRRGVHVVADGVLVQDVTVRDLYVHDVDGDLAKDSDGSGGIQVDVHDGGRFAGLRIERNRIADVSRSGIFVVAGSGTRPRAGEPWPGASTDVVVSNNRLTRLGGDGIVALGTVGAVLEDNVVSTGNLRGFDYADPNHVCNAGIWTFDANDTLIQRNEVFDMRFNGCDGTGFDVDYAQDGTIVQDNYSHDNGGGFILLCTDPNPRRADVRFNLSVNDAFAATTAPCAFPQTGTYEGVRFYNNTIVGPSPLLGFQGQVFGALFDPEHLEFHNNLLFATRPQPVSFPCGARCSNNLFFAMPPSGARAVSADPVLIAPRRDGRGRLAVASAFRLRRGSAAIGAGVAIPGSPEHDYFGRRFATTLPPAIGFFQP